jgi:DNA-nicking Smr family endonuclease
MAARGPKDDEDRALFEQALRDLAPPAGGAGRLTRLKEQDAGALDDAPPPVVARRRSRQPAGRQPAGLRVEVDGGRMVGLAPGVDRRQLRRLRRGQVPVDHEIDLHGYTEAQARQNVRRELLLASQRGWRCVRIIHGRAVGSATGPVLKRALPGWLEEAAPAVRVLAFTTAAPQLGGAGATLVLLALSSG